jgi:hypothetical protein
MSSQQNCLESFPCFQAIGWFSRRHIYRGCGLLIAAWRRGVCPSAMLVTTDQVSPHNLVTVFRVYRFQCDVLDHNWINQHLVGTWREFVFYSLVIFNFIFDVYVQLKVQLDVLFICILYSSLFLALHVSGAIAPILRSTNYSLQP